MVRFAITWLLSTGLHKTRVYRCMPEQVETSRYFLIECGERYGLHCERVR